MKRNILLIFYILAGVIVGALVANVCVHVPLLSWLAYSGTIGFNPGNPFVLDLSVFELTFGFSMSVSVAQIITISLAIFFYNKTKLR